MDTLPYMPTGTTKEDNYIDTVKATTYLTSCARGDTIRLRPLQVDNIFVFIRQMAPVPACWLFKTSATILCQF